MIRKIKILKIVSIILFSLKSLIAQTVNFTPAGQGTDYMRYNVTTSTAANSGGLTGGFTMTGSAFNDLNMYILQFSFDGTSWNTDVSAMVATTGGLVAGGNGGRFTSTDGNAQISVSHEVLAAVSTWPGNDGSIRLRINESGSASYYPTSAGITWPIDLTRPSISTSSIVSNNTTNNAYATTNDVITLSITASENLMNDGIYIFNGNISGLDFITQAGGDATQWSFASTVTTHAEATVTYDIAYYDENYNLGVSSITSTTDGTTVIVDRTTPTLDVSITSNNSNNTSLAKEGDQLTLTISASETLHEAPTVTIMNEPSPTVSPPAQSRDYTATHSPTDANGDEEGTVTFSISGVKDRAGNQIGSAVVSTNDGTSVEFDITAPVVQTITSSSNNTYSNSRAKEDDIITVSFSSTEKIQTPTVLIAGEAAVETNANGDQVTWTATKTMDAEDNDDNIIDLSIVYTDLAGNAGLTKTENNLEANSSVVFDNTPPNEPDVTVASSNTINNSYAIQNSIVSVDITSNEDLLDDTNGDEIPDGISNVRIAERDVTNIGVETLTRNSGTSFSAQVQLTGFETEEVVTYSFTMTDLTGNTRTVTANTSNILIDNAAPTITPVSIVSNNATNTSYAKTDDVITLSFTSNEDLSSATGHTPTATIGITNVTPAAITGRTEFAATLTTSNSMAEEQVGFTLNATDVAGNSVTVDAVTDGSSVTIDNSAPSVNYLRLSSTGAVNTYAKAGEVVTLDFQADEELSSISTITIFGSAPDAAATDLGNNIFRAQYTLQGTENNGSVPFALNFIDQAGNTLAGNLTSLVDDPDGGVIYDDEAPTLDRVTITSSNSNSATLAKVDDVITFSITASEQIKTPQIVIAGRTGAGAATLSDDTNTDGLQIYTATYTMKQDDPEGVVAFTVDFQDLASNTGTQVIALTAEDLDGGVTFDKTPPFFNQTIGGEVGSVTISSNNANGNTNLAKIGDQITLSFVATEVIKVGSNPTVVINNNNAVVGRVGDTDKIFTATYSMSAISDGNVEIDPVTFLISGYEDAAGNAGADVNATTDGSTIKYDPVIPTLSNVAMASSNDVNPAFAKADDIITITFNSNETLKFTDADGDGVVDPDATEPSISILGSTAGVTITQPQANSWQAIKTVAASDDEIEVPFSITYGDPAGNVASSPITTVQTGNAVTVDRTSPSLTKVDVKAANSTDSSYVTPDDEVIITIIADEAIQAPTVSTNHGSAPTVSNVDGGLNRKWEARHTAGEFENLGEMTFSVSISDLADNGPVVRTSLLNDLDGLGVTYDNTRPEIQDITFTSNNTVNSAFATNGNIVTLSFNASEQLRQNTIVIDIDADGDGDFDDSAADGDVMVVEPTTGISDGLEPWSANYTISGTMDDDEVTTINYRINFQDLFTVAGTPVQNGLTGNITFDSTDPTVTPFTVTTDNLRGEEYLVKELDIITVNMTSSEILPADPHNPTISFDGVEVDLTAVAGSDTQWEATYTVPDNTTIGEGTVPIILNYKDNANRSGTPLQVTSDNKTLKFDKTPPSLTAISISSNNSYNSSMAKVGDVVTIAFTGSHSLNASPGVSVLGNAADQVSQGADDTQWNASYTLQEGDSEGAITFTVDYTDLALNQGVQKTQSDITDGTSITFDKTATVVTGYTLSLDPNSDTGSASDDLLTNDGTPTFNVSNLTSGDAETRATNDWLILFVDGVRFDSVQVSSDNESVTIGDARDLPNSPNAYPITFKTRDQAGNLSDETAAVNITIDKDIPAAGETLDLQAAFDTGISDVDDITNATEPVFTLSGLGPIGNHSINLYYQRSNNAVVDTFLLSHTLAQQVSDVITIPEGLALSEDLYSFWYEVVDDAGNVSLNSGNRNITVDLTPPSASATPDLLDDGGDDGVFEFDTGTSSTDNITNLATVQLTISGLSTDDNTVIIYDTKNTNDETDDEVMAEETIVATSMNITINNISTTTYGTKITDASGNSSILSELLSITFDNTPTDVLGFDDLLTPGGIAGNYSDVFDGSPNEYPPVTIDLIGATDTGSDTTDHITNQTLPSFRIKNLTDTDSVFLFATVAGNPDNLVAKGVVDNSTEILTVTDGSTPLHLLSELTQNDYIIKLRVKDVAGNISAFTQFQFNADGTYTNDEFVLSVDTTPFTITSEPDLVVTDDTGISDSDNITSVRNPEFQFLNLDASADSVELYVTNSGGATALTNSGFKAEGDFDYLLQVSSDLVAGDYNFKYRVIDIAGNESAYSSELPVTIDYTAPNDPSNLDLIDADDNGPSNSDDLTNAASMTLTGDGFVSGEYGFLYFYDGPGDADPSNDILVQSVLLGDSDVGTASFTVANNATGAFNYYVIAQDLAGNSSLIASAPTLTIDVDLDPPAIDNLVLSLDPDSDTGIQGDNASSTTTPTFIITDSGAGLTVTDSVIIYYQLANNSIDPSSGLNGVPKRYAALSIDEASESLTGFGFDENDDGILDEGPYYIYAKLRDFAGNLSVFSVDVGSLVYRLDTTPPLFYDVGAQQSDPSQSFTATDLIAVDDLGYSSTDNITKKQNPSFTVSNLHPFKNDKVVLFARKAFTTTKVDSGFVAELETDITLTVPWIDANGDEVVDDVEGFALDDGTWTMTYTVEDSAGNITSDIPALTVEVDATAPSTLGRPDLLTAFDTGESNIDNLTNLNVISIDQTDTIPGLQWSLYRFEDNGDGVYNSNDDAIFPLDSNLFPGGQGDDGLDLNNDGVPDGAGSVTSNIAVDQDPTYYFFSVQTDVAGNRSSGSDVLTVGVDFVAPNCVITYNDPDGDGIPDDLVRSADGTLNANFTFDDSIDDLENPPSIIIDYPDPLGPSETLPLSKVNDNDDTVWEYNIPLNELEMDQLNGLIDITLTSSDKYGNATANITGNDQIRIDNLPAVFSSVVPGSGSFSNADSIIAFSWNLDEPNEGTNIVSAEIEFFNLNSNQTFVAQLSNPSDLEEGDRTPGIIDNWGAASIPLSEGVYQVVFNSLDFAGNVGNDTLINFTYDLTSPNAEISFSRLYAEDGDTVVVTVVFDEDIYHNEDDLPTFSASLPQEFAQPLTGPLTLVNPPETYDDIGVDNLENSGDDTEGNGQYDLGEPFNDINGNGVYDAIGELYTWSYTFTTGDLGSGLNGVLSDVTIENAQDLAGNLVATLDLDADNDGVDDILYIDNTIEIATFSYENLTNPSLTDGDPEDEGFTGISGDTIIVTVTTNQQISATSPVPTIDFEYNASNNEVQGDLVTGVNLAAPSLDGLIWEFQVILADSVYNDGIMNFSFNGKDLADNVVEVENFIDNAIFAVDNLPPAYYETGEVTIVGSNPVQGWITGNTTEILTSVYIEDIQVDSTLVDGQVEIQFYNQTRGQSWVTVGQNDDIVLNGDFIDYSRTDDDLYVVMDPNSFGPDGLQPGDLLEVRAKVIDKHANVTSFGTSTTVLKYDPSGPSVGQITGGVFGNTSSDTTYVVYSSDQVDIFWTPFQEINPNESGLKEYALSILKRDSTTGGQLETFLDTVITASANPLQPDTLFSQALFLRHNTRYVAQIVGIDTAGNFSDTLSSDTLLRLNSAPIISTIPGENIDEDELWNQSIQITDLDLVVLQGDTHVYAIDSTSIDIAAYIDQGLARGGTYRDVYLSWSASRQDEFYTGCVIEISTAGDPQLRTIIAYDGDTRTATVSDGASDLSPTPAQGTQYTISPSVPSIDSATGIMTWVPRQTNNGPVDVVVTVTDEYGLVDTTSFILVVQAVNDPPESILSDSLSTVVWEEDASTTLNIGKYFFDVDNKILESEGFEWSVVILDTNELDEDFPAGTVIPGPGASNEFIAKLTRDYMGFDPNMNFTSRGLTSSRLHQINNARNDHPINILIFETPDQDGDGDNDSTMALFSSDTNYYGSDHIIRFIGRDNEGDMVTDSILATIEAKNDPPKIDSLPNYVMNENDTLWLKFGPYTSDVDDDTLTFKITALTYDDKMTIRPMGINQDSIFQSSSYDDSIQFIPSPLWSKDHIIQVVVFDNDASDTSSFVLDIERVLRPHFSVSVTQNNAFNKYFQIIVMDTVEKAIFVSLDVANSQRNIDEIADFTYIAHVYMESSGNYPIDVSANAVVGDTTIREYFSLAAGRTASRWAGQSFDGKFTVVGNPGAITYDQSLLIVDSTLFDKSFHDKASYVLGNEDFEFNQPIEIRMAHERDDVAIYRRKNGSIWEELPSISMDGEIFTLSERAGYFKLGPKTIIVPEQTSIHQNYPNPFNPTTTIMYDIGLLDGLKQKVSIRVYNLLGQHVTTLIKNKDQIGQFKIQWNGTDKFGQQMSSGVYFIQLSTKTGIIRNKKMMLLK